MGKAAERFDMGALAGRGGQLRSRFVTLPGNEHSLLFGGEAEEVTLEDMRHHEIRRRVDRCIHRGYRIADEAL